MRTLLGAIVGIIIVILVAGPFMGESWEDFSQAMIERTRITEAGKTERARIAEEGETDRAMIAIPMMGIASQTMLGVVVIAGGMLFVYGLATAGGGGGIRLPQRQPQPQHAVVPYTPGRPLASYGQCQVVVLLPDGTMIPVPPDVLAHTQGHYLPGPNAEGNWTMYDPRTQQAALTSRIPVKSQRLLAAPAPGRV
jgi:hypothetical protein